MKIALNGNICDANHAVISVYDHGFLYGMGLFETFRTYGGRAFLLEEHLMRLYQSCQEIGIQWEPNIKEVENLIEALLTANQLTDGYIRFTVSAGEEALGLPMGDYKKCNTIMYIKELPAIDQVLYEVGKPLQRLKIRRNTPEGALRLKSFHYMNNILAKREMQTYPWADKAEGLLLTAENYLAEGIVSNLFFIRNQACYTPSLQTGILAGITRSHVMKLCAQLGLKVVEGFYIWDDLLLADEIFMTNSIQEIIPIHQLFDEQGDLWKVGAGHLGPISKQLLGEYRKSTGGYEYGA